LEQSHRRLADHVVIVPEFAGHARLMKTRSREMFRDHELPDR
jgi:hypothetical protein